MHCALVMVNGRVRTDAEATNPPCIAEQSWSLYDSQGNGHMEVETDIDPTKADYEEDHRRYNGDYNGDLSFFN